jgi:hypothetical protein
MEGMIDPDHPRFNLAAAHRPISVLTGSALDLHGLS